jgi:hypothetical protein
MNTLDPLYWTQNSCFGSFQTVSLLHEVALDLFATNTPDPLHWTQNSCLGALM